MSTYTKAKMCVHLLNPRRWRLTIRTWNLHSLSGKELVGEAERHQLEIVGPPFMHCVESENLLLSRGWTVFRSGVGRGEKQQTAVGLLKALQLGRHVLRVITPPALGQVFYCGRDLRTELAGQRTWPSWGLCEG